MKASLNSGSHAWDSGFQVLGSGFIVSGTWIPDSNRDRDSVILELNFGFQSPGVRIPQVKISRIPDSNDQTFQNFLIREENTQGWKLCSKNKSWIERKTSYSGKFVLRYAKSYNRVCLFSDEYCIKHEVFNSKISANLETVNL